MTQIRHVPDALHRKLKSQAVSWEALWDNRNLTLAGWISV